MSFAAPDIAGFFAASRELRQNFGNPTAFSIPTAPQWPAGTQLNPDTGRPYSPMVKPTNAGFTTVTIIASAILKEASPLRPQADTDTTAVGRLSGMDIILDIDVADYPAVQEATEFEYASRHYRVVEFKPFKMTGQVYRYLVYGQER